MDQTSCCGDLVTVHMPWLEVCLGCGGTYIEGEYRHDVALPLIRDLQTPSVLLFNILHMLTDHRRASAVQMLDDVLLTTHDEPTISHIHDLVAHTARLKDKLPEAESWELEAKVRDAALAGADLRADIESVQRFAGTHQINAIAVLAYFYVDRLISDGAFDDGSRQDV